MRFRLAHLVPLALLLLLAPLSRAGDAAPKKPVPALQRVAVAGASISAGFGLDPAADAFSGQASRVQLAQVVEASLAAPHEPVHNGASMLFFTAPEATAKRALQGARDAKASAFVALDYLFWMGYGAGTDTARRERLEAGLKLLEGFEGPILLGDLPDFRGAEVNPLFLPPAAIPAPETLAALNARIAEWAKARSNVVVVPLAETMRKLLADEPFDVRGNRFEKGARARLLQADHLHTTLEGTCALWAIAVDAWCKADRSLPADAFDLDVARLAQKAGAALGTPPAKKPAAPAPKPARPAKPVGAGAGK
jgi:hypothetical protein